MTEKTLETLFHDTLRDVLYAERRMLKTLPKLARRARSGALREALSKHREETEGQIERLGPVFEALGKRAQGKTCPAIDGIIEEGDEVAEAFADSPALDAGLIAAARAVEHYEIARYEALAAWAGRLGLYDAARLLEASLAEERAAEETLAGIADEALGAAIATAA